MVNSASSLYPHALLSPGDHFLSPGTGRPYLGSWPPREPGSQVDDLAQDTMFAAHAPKLLSHQALTVHGAASKASSTRGMCRKQFNITPAVGT